MFLIQFLMKNISGSIHWRFDRKRNTNRMFSRGALTVSQILFVIGVVLLFSSQVYASNWEVRQISSDPINDKYLDFNEGSAVWTRGDGSNSEVFLYDSTVNQVAQITSNGSFLYDTQPSIWGRNIVWGRGPVVDSVEIYLENIDSGVRTQITSNNYNDREAEIYENKIVWMGKTLGSGNGGREIFLYDGNSTQQITNNSYRDDMPRIWDDKIIWRGYRDNNYQIMLYDIIDDQTTQLTNDNEYSVTGDIWDNYVVWGSRLYESLPGGEKVFLHNLETDVTINLTEDIIGGGGPRIHDNNVVWTGLDGYIYLYDIITEQTTKGSLGAGPVIWGDEIAFVRDGDIYIAIIPEPTTFSLLCVSGLILLRRRAV